MVGKKKEPDFSWRCTAKEQESMDTSCRKGNFRKENHHHSEGSKELEKVAQGGCSIFTLGEALQHLTGHVPELD